MDALKSGAVEVSTMDNKLLEIGFDEIISPDTFKVIPNRGMPILNDNPLSPIRRDFQNGNLVVKFDIQFPNDLSQDKKAALCAILDEVDE